MRRQISQMRLRQLACALFLALTFGLAAAETEAAQQPLVPFLDEVTVNPIAGVATAYFGYNNPNALTVTVVVGPQNFMFPSPEDRGQTVLFSPGVHHYAFAVVSNYQVQPTITWVLQSSPVTADSAAALPQTQNSVFTYQGRLTDGTNAASGAYQMQFALFDAATGGTQVGLTLTNTNVNVLTGLFTVQLDFGPGPFRSGADRYLEIAVKRPADAAFTTLAPRQQLTSSPFAIHTISASSADSLSNSCVGCVTSAQIGSVDGSKVSGNVATADNATAATTAGNVTGVVSVANGGTGSSAKNFVDLSTNQSIGGNKTFTGVLSGSFSGDGSGLSNVSGSFTWQVVAGTSQQAQVNTGYVVTNANQVTITLPATPNVGDIVRVSGAGAGGWRICQNGSQLILGANLDSYNRWSAREGNRSWASVASSADGSKLVALVFGGLIYTSVDSGQSWTARAISLGNKNWSGVASSADGIKLVAVVAGGQIYTSINSGLSWTVRDSNRNWSGVASSTDGSKLVAVENGGSIYTSHDSGANWANRTPNETRPWSAVASSADGSKLVAVVLAGKIDTSTDSGMTWTPRESNRDWSSVASSADGTQLLAVAYGGQIYTSTDSGLSWTARDNARNWSAIASSADGSKLVAVINGGQIYTSSSRTTFGREGYLLGGPFTAIELQYLGGGLFLPLSHEGTILNY